MVSEFRKKKFLHIFNSFFDINGSGIIDKQNLSLAAEKIAKLRGWKAGDAQFKVLEETMEFIWNDIQSADADKDGSVSKEEWISIWDAYSKNPAGASDWQKLYCKITFLIEDASLDGSIDAEEFSTVYASFGIDKDEAVTAFQKMSKGKATVSSEEFEELWKEYFTTEDVNAPGNFIFGRTSF